MSIPKRCRRPYKNQASIVASGPFRISSQSRNNELSTPPGAPKKPIDLSNPGPSSAPSQVPKYTKDDLQWIFKMVLEAQTSTCGQNLEISEDLPELALKPRALDVYKGKLHMDY